MKKNLLEPKSKNRKLKYLILVGVTLLAWIPVLCVPFINDDYQILGYNAGGTLISIFKPFWSPDVSLYYWRPLGNMIHPLIINIAGFEPLPFRMVSLAFYAVCCSAVLYAAFKMGLNGKIAAGFAVLFALLPSHELQVAWIAEQGESLLAFLLILSFIYYFTGIQENYISRKYFYGFLLLFTASLLVKELAFVGIFIPFIVYIAKKDSLKNKIGIYAKHSAVALVILCIVLLYRFTVIGNSLFNSPNFSGTGPAVWIKNFVIYIPLAFLPPEALEYVFYNLHNPILDLTVLIFIFLIIYLCFYAFVRINKEKKNMILAGIAWYVVFVIPALLSLMRWYVFTASAGLIWSAAFIFEYYWQTIKSKKMLAVVIILFFALLAVYNFSVMNRWVNTGKKFQSSLNSLKEIKPEIKSDSIFVWCIPDKFERIPMMKLGVQQSINWILKNKNLTVYSPLRAELTGGDSKIKFFRESDSVFIFQLYGGRFLPMGGKSRSVIGDEKILFSNENVSLVINTFKIGNFPESEAAVKLKRNNYRLGQIYYNGKKFLKIN